MPTGTASPDANLLAATTISNPLDQVPGTLPSVDRQRMTGLVKVICEQALDSPGSRGSAAGMLQVIQRMGTD